MHSICVALLFILMSFGVQGCDQKWLQRIKRSSEKPDPDAPAILYLPLGQWFIN